MATDWARHSLTCNAIAPGYVDTPLNAARVADPEFPAWLEWRTPAGRWATGRGPASFVNGHVLHVGGGITALH